MTTNPNNPAFTNIGTIVFDRGTHAADYRTLAVTDAEVIAWDAPEHADTDNLFAVESFNFPGVFSYAVVEPVARKSTRIGGNDSNALGYRVRVTFINEEIHEFIGHEAWILAK